MSRAKIQEFLHDWVNTELSIGTDNSEKLEKKVPRLTREPILQWQ